MIKVEGDGYANCSDFIITKCIHESKYHIVSHEYAQLLYVKSKKTKIKQMKTNCLSLTSNQLEYLAGLSRVVTPFQIQ